MTEENAKTEIPPSLDLAFDWLKGDLHRQVKLAEEYDTRLATIFSVATAIVGIGVPFSIGIMKDIPRCSTSFVMLVAAAVIYAFVALSVFIGFWMRDYETLDDPQIIREDFWTLDTWRFKEEMLLHLEESHKANEKKLHWKILPTRIAALLLPLETIALLLGFLLWL